MIEKQIDLLKPKLDIKYFAVLVIIIVMLLVAWALSGWIFGKVEGAIKSKAVGEDTI